MSRASPKTVSVFPEWQPAFDLTSRRRRPRVDPIGHCVTIFGDDTVRSASYVRAPNSSVATATRRFSTGFGRRKMVVVPMHPRGGGGYDVARRAPHAGWENNCGRQVARGVARCVGTTKTRQRTLAVALL